MSAEPSFAELTTKLMSDKKLGLSAAQAEAARLIIARREHPCETPVLQLVVPLDDGAFSLRDVRRIVQGAEVEPQSAGVRLMGPGKWADDSPVKLVWIQLAEVGEWNGHPEGAFKLDAAIFADMVRNFDARGLPIPWDYEHASEQDPTQGSVPLGGTPAPAWVHQLENRGPEGLWGLCELLDQARGQVKRGEYAFLSPAIRFGARDPKSGTKQIARLSSVALTNQPFLTGLGQLVAAKDVKPTAVPTLAELQALPFYRRPLDPQAYIDRVRAEAEARET
jgi:hypothetical protein